MAGTHKGAVKAPKKAKNRKVTKTAEVVGRPPEPEGQIFNGVNTLDEPSAGWGWSQIGGTTIQIAGWISVVLLVVFNFGNHRGHVETIYLVLAAVVIALGLIIFAIKPSLTQVRTVTANNQPLGWEEPDWNRDQMELTGVYANLTDSQYRAINVDPQRISRPAELS